MIFKVVVVFLDAAHDGALEEVREPRIPAALIKHKKLVIHRPIPFGQVLNVCSLPFNDQFLLGCLLKQFVILRLFLFMVLFELVVLVHYLCHFLL